MDPVDCSDFSCNSFSLAPMYYRDAAGALIVYDITDRVGIWWFMGRNCLLVNLVLLGIVGKS